MTRLLAGHELRSGFPSSSRSDDPTSSRIAIARRIWNASQPIANTPAAIYLRRRGVGILETSSALRFSPACRHQNGEYHAAMIAAVTSSNGEITAIHRTFITPDGRKAQLDPVKSTLGFVSGGAIRLAPAAETMCVAEGIETDREIAVLRSLDIHLGQGYALGRPQPVGALPIPVRRRA